MVRVSADFAGNKLIPKADVKEILMNHEDPLQLLSHAAKSIEAGLLTLESYSKLNSAYLESKTSIAEVISETADNQIDNSRPVLESLPKRMSNLEIIFKIGLYMIPDLAAGVEVDIKVNFDITGNSVTGKCQT